MTGMRAARRSDLNALRGLLGAAGVVATGFGLWHALAFDIEQAVSAVLWLAAVVVVHDTVLSPLLVALGYAHGRVVSRPWRAPLAVAAVVWGAMTVVALPVLSGMGERPDNPTLLDRPYATAWWLGTALVAGCVLAYGLLTRGRGGDR